MRHVSAGNLPGTGFGITDRLLMEYVRPALPVGAFSCFHVPLRSAWLAWHTALIAAVDRIGLAGQPIAAADGVRLVRSL